MILQKICGLISKNQLTSSTNLLIRSVKCLMRFSRAAICGVVGICNTIRQYAHS